MAVTYKQLCKQKDKQIRGLERQIDELKLEINKLRNTFLRPKKKPFDAPQPSIKVKLLGEIPNPFIQ